MSRRPSWLSCEGYGRRGGCRRSARFPLRGEPFHGANAPYGLAGLRFATLLGGLRLHPHEARKILGPGTALEPVQELICTERSSRLGRHVCHWGRPSVPPLEGEGFEPSVPPDRVSSVVAPCTRSGPRRSCVHFGAGAAAVQLDLFFAASHSMEPGAHTVWVGCGSPRCSAACARVHTCPSPSSGD